MAQALSRVCGQLLSSARRKEKLTTIVKRFCTSDLLNKKEDVEKSALIRKNGWIRKSILNAFMKFVRGYESVLEKRFPWMFRVYRIFTIGSRDFYNEAKTYAHLSKEIRQGKELKSLTRKELEIYFEIPKQLLKVAPILVLSTLPLTNYFIFPLVYLYPRQILTPHFWSIQQRMDFALIYHKKRLRHYRPVFRHLQSTTTAIANSEIQERCLDMWHKLGSGIHPETEEILAVKSVFCDKPFNISHLSAGHLSGLCRIHGLSSLGFLQRRLWNRAAIISELDLAIERENINNLNLDDMRNACFLRGLNPVGMQKEDMLKFLKQWISLSSKLNGTESSLLLHCPILLTYNQPTNWALIH